MVQRFLQNIQHTRERHGPSLGGHAVPYGSTASIGIRNEFGRSGRVLAELHGNFSEGFDTFSKQHAKAILDKLASSN